jgi:hypothetical protein
MLSYARYDYIKVSRCLLAQLKYYAFILNIKVKAKQQEKVI